MTFTFSVKISALLLLPLLQTVSVAAGWIDDRQMLDKNLVSRRRMALRPRASPIPGPIVATFGITPTARYLQCPIIDGYSFEDSTTATFASNTSPTRLTCGYGLTTPLFGCTYDTVTGSLYPAQYPLCPATPR